MAAESQVHVSGKGENIHIQRDPLRGRRGYYVKGWTPGTEAWPLQPHVYDPGVDCEPCKGRGMVPNEAVNKYRSHYMQHIICPACEGTGRKDHEDGQRN